MDTTVKEAGLVCLGAKVTRRLEIFLKKFPSTKATFYIRIVESLRREISISNNVNLECNTGTILPNPPRSIGPGHLQSLQSKLF